MSEASNTASVPAAEFGARLAGITDGEGHFAITRQRREGRVDNYGCGFVLNMRDDDTPFIEWLHEQSGGLGNIYHTRAIRQRTGWITNPTVYWRVENKSDCLKLLPIFERYPPLSKKARDFEIWAQAVRYWNGPKPEGSAPMARWYEEIRRVRAYRGQDPIEAELHELTALSLFDEAIL